MRTVIVPGRSGDGPIRMYALALDGSSAPYPVTPEGMAFGETSLAVSPDGRSFVAQPADGAPVAVEIAGGTIRPKRMLKP